MNRDIKFEFSEGLFLLLKIYEIEISIAVGKVLELIISMKRFYRVDFFKGEPLGSVITSERYCLGIKFSKD